ncbi:MAG: hypothetical protein GXZ06_00850 [Tissierellia bacterium]|nr:hypothetical protein [Tissierellia bacterium]
MKRYFFRYKHKINRIVGIALAVIGLLIIINVMPVEFLLFLIGLALILMAILLIK